MKRKQAGTIKLRFELSVETLISNFHVEMGILDIFLKFLKFRLLHFILIIKARIDLKEQPQVPTYIDPNASPSTNGKHIPQFAMHQRSCRCFPVSVALLLPC